MPRVRKLLEAHENVILESNSVLRFLRPDLYLSVLDPRVADVKPSSQRFLDRADAIVLPDGVEISRWTGISPGLLLRLPRYVVSPPQYMSSELVHFSKLRLRSAEEHAMGEGTAELCSSQA